jgi:hypothetical protein
MKPNRAQQPPRKHQDTKKNNSSSCFRGFVVAFCGSWLVLSAASCSERASAPGPAAVRFVDLYKPEMLHGSAPASP